MADDYIGVGGLGGFTVYDLRQVVTNTSGQKTIRGSALTLSGEGFKMWGAANKNNTIIGGGFEFKQITNIYSFLAVFAALNMTFGSIHYNGTGYYFTTIGGSLGFAF